MIALDKNNMTGHFITALPKLLHKFMLDSDKMVHLLEIPRFMNLEMYTTQRQEKNLDLTLKFIKEAVEKHQDVKVLKAASKTLQFLCSDKELSIFARCDNILQQVLPYLCQGFKQSFNKCHGNSRDETTGEG